MAKPLSEKVFFYLVFGLAKYTENESKYPYPSELLYAQHHLSLAMRTSYPTTITDFLNLCQKPLEEWWPGGIVPAGIDRRFEILTEGEELSQQVIDYLTTYKLPVEVTFRDIPVILDNQLMIDILRKARQAETHDPAVANREYMVARKFVITNPWTTREKLHRSLRGQCYITPSDVGNLYQNSQDAGSFLLYQKPGTTEPCYWNCDRCGPLYKRHDQPGSLKPGACEKRCPGPTGWHALGVWDHPLVLKRGIHLRTLIPGIAEIDLYEWLTNEVQPGKPHLQQVVLWPGVDRYDLQLDFFQEIWAVDVKDYKDPFALGQHIKNADRDQHLQRSDLAWNKWFYVYPTYREWQRLDYHDCVLRAIGPLSPNVTILSEKLFKAKVQAC